MRAGTSCNLLSDTWSNVWPITSTRCIICGLINDKLVRILHPGDNSSHGY